MKTAIDATFRFVTKYRNLLVTLFEIFFLVQLVVILFGYRAIVTKTGDPRPFFLIGRKAGDLAISLYILTLIPGIVRRFGKFYKLTAILMMFRRYIGIAAFLFVLMHASFVRFFSAISFGTPLVPADGFEMYGLIASVMLFFLFITSNDLSTKLLGSVWNRIHTLTYIIMWVIMVHVSLLQSNWILPIAIAGGAEIASFIRVWMKKAKNN